jgi:hypothetical protein
MSENMNEEEAVEIMKEFVSGQMAIEDFWKIFKADETIKDILVNDEKKWAKKLGWHWDGLGSALGAYEKHTMNFQSYRETYYLHWVVCKHIWRNEISVKIDRFYPDRIVFLIDIQPSWLDIDDEEFLKDLISQIPADIKTRGQRVKWCKDRLKEMFRYDKSPPRWIQPPKWPIVNGKPLVFKRKSRERIDDEQVDFFFYDPDTMEETVVTQFY